MARSPKEAIAIIVDVGSRVWRDAVTDKEPGFLEKTVQCVSMIIKRKIFAKSKDEVALILMGTEETDNSLNYENIRMVYPLVSPSWEMLDFLDKDLKGTKINADWLDAIVVAMGLLKQESESKVFLDKKIVLFTDLSSQISKDKIEPIINSMQNESFRLIVIGPDIHLNANNEAMENASKHGFANGTKSKKTKEQLCSEQILMKILKEAGGVISSFEDAIPQLMFFEKKKIRPSAWNVLLDLGPEIKIPLSGFKKIQPATLPSWKISLKGGTDVMSETVFTRQDENLTNVNSEDLIAGYKYGTTVVPISDVDVESMGYKSGPKCLSVLGFTKSKNVPRHLIVGSGVLYLTTRKNDETAVYALSALVNAMIRKNVVAIARKVYRDNSRVTLGALYPKQSTTYECLVFVEIPFAEDIREFRFPSLNTRKNQPSQEQLDAIDLLINNMDLTSVTNEFGEKSEACKPKSMLNPYHQHWCSSLAHRALHPDEKLPEVSEHVKKLMQSPFETKSYNLALDEIRKHFPIIKVEMKATRKHADKFFKVDDVNEPKQGPSGVNLNHIKMTDLVQPTILEVGTLHAVRDFKALLEKGEPLDKLCTQMNRAIIQTIVWSVGKDAFDKAEAALRELRCACVLKNPSLYNDWIPKFKMDLFERGRGEFWDVVVKGNLGLITSNENASSSVTDDDARKFLEYEEAKEEAPVEEDMDEDDLLNEM